MVIRFFPEKKKMENFMVYSPGNPGGKKLISSSWGYNSTRKKQPRIRINFWLYVELIFFFKLKRVRT